MGRSGRWSLLQTEILAQLRKGPVDSVSDLARKLEKSRPAVSRALKTLSDQGIVQRLGRSWSLTETGVVEADKAVARLQESTEDIVEVAGQRFRAMSRAGLDDAVSASMTALIGPGIAEAASNMLAQETIRLGLASLTEAMVPERGTLEAMASLGSGVAEAASNLLAQETAMLNLGPISEAMVPDRSALEAISSLGSFQDTLANLGGISGLIGEASGLGLQAMSGESLASAMREAAGISHTQELLASFSSGLAFDAAKTIGSISAWSVPGELTRELGLSLTQRMDEVLGASVRAFADHAAMMIPDHSTLLGADYLALAKTVEVISGSPDHWPMSFVKAASALAEWEEPFADAFMSYHADNAAMVGDILSGLARVDLPEPLLSDALRVYGLNSERIHTPTYWIPPVEPVESVTEAWLRASAARRRRINDARDTLIALEETVRSLIETELSRQHGSAWWKRGVPQCVREGCEQRKRDREAAGGLKHKLIDYTYTSELKDIIVKGDNWSSVFSSVFRNKTLVEAVFLWIEPVRKDIAHSRPSSDRDYKQFKFAATWLIEAIADVLDEDVEIDAAD